MSTKKEISCSRRDICSNSNARQLSTRTIDVQASTGLASSNSANLKDKNDTNVFEQALKKQSASPINLPSKKCKPTKIKFFLKKL